MRALAFSRAVSILLLLALPAQARTTAWATRVCPLTGKPFPTIEEASGTQVCLRLDLKPIGFIGAPPAVPICPDDGFVVYKSEFSEQEKAVLRPWVQSREFRDLTLSESPYFRIAMIQEKLSEPPLAVAHSYLAASWEVEFDPDRYRRYVTLAVAKLQAHLQEGVFDAASEQGRRTRAETILLAAELNRRIGQLDDARRLLVDLPKNAATDLLDIIGYELELLDRADTGPHYLPRAEEARCATLDLKRPEPPPNPRGTYAPPAPTLTSGPLPADKLRP